MSGRQIDQRQAIGKPDEMLYYINMLRIQYEKSQKGNRIHQILPPKQLQPICHIPYSTQTRPTVYYQTRVTNSKEGKTKTFE